MNTHNKLSRHVRTIPPEEPLYVMGGKWMNNSCFLGVGGWRRAAFMICLKLQLLSVCNSHVDFSLIRKKVPRLKLLCQTLLEYLNQGKIFSGPAMTAMSGMVIRRMGRKNAKTNVLALGPSLLYSLRSVSEAVEAGRNRLRNYVCSKLVGSSRHSLLKYILPFTVNACLLKPQPAKKRPNHEIRDINAHTWWAHKIRGVSPNINIKIIHIALSHLSLKKTTLSLQIGQTKWQAQKLINFILHCTWKTKFFGMTFSDSFRRNLSLYPHCQDILQLLLARFGIFCLLVEVDYWQNGLKFVYPTINLAFLEVIVKFNYLQNFTCTVSNDFVSK